MNKYFKCESKRPGTLLYVSVSSRKMPLFMRWKKLSCIYHKLSKKFKFYVLSNFSRNVEL